MRGDVFLPWSSKMDTYTLQLPQSLRSLDWSLTSASRVPGIDRSPSFFLEYGFWPFSDSKSPTVEDSNLENPPRDEITILTDFIIHSSFRRRHWNQMEQTFIMIKPDGVQRGLVGEIIKRFEARGYFLRGLKMLTVDKPFAETHYKDLADKPFFPALIEYITSGAVVAMVWEGQDAAKQGRKMLGKTNPLDSEPGTIRGDFSLIMGRNIIHGSDSVESAKAEIALWFPEGLNEYEHHSKPWIYE